MNSSRLLELVERLIKVEESTNVNGVLSQCTESMQNIVNAPNEPGHQTQYAERFNALKANMKATIASFSPAEVALMNEIGAQAYFATDLSDEISAEVAQNAVTPAVVVTKISAIRDKRVEYLAILKSLRQNLQAIGIKSSTLEVEGAEIGILLPRSLFDNHFKELIDQLGTINRIFRIFSEVVTGEVEPVEVRQISTSDPVFAFGMSIATIAAIGKAITWALATWKTVEEIRKLRREAQNIPAMSKERIDQMFGETIREAIDKAIASHVAELVPAIPGEDVRRNEQRIGMEWALKSILSRIERGMTVEVRFLPPPQPAADAAPVELEKAAQFTTLSEIAAQLTFPQAQPDPILQLPPPSPPEPPAKKTKA
ncbi:hypothetical protein [Reyranella sp.]|uniref:hypothetical protein n=1 Tax=Reyranella sp. TaxID=1929291 RepID=UPI003F71EF69